MTLITWSQFYDYVKCPHRVYLDHHGDPAERDPISDFTRLLWERGILHEERTVGGMALEEVAGPPNDDAARTTLQFMSQGAALIYQGVLCHEDMLARPDFLRRNDSAPSELGPYHYVPLDIKSGRGFDDAGNRRKEYALQLRFSAEVLGHIQGYRPRQASVINIDGDEIPYPLSEWDDEFHRVLRDLRALARRDTENLPVLGAHCKECHWFTHCQNWAHRSQDISLIYRLGWNAAVELRRRGITTLSNMAQVDISAFLRPPLKIRGIGEKSLVAFRRRAEAYLRGGPAKYGQLDLPETTVHIFFDAEDDPTQDIYYLLGLLLVTDDGDKYHAFVAESPDDEGRMWGDFLTFMNGLTKYTLYHYSSHEPTVVRRLFQKYGSDPDRVAPILDRAIDLFRAVEQLSDWPDFSYGLKAIASRLGFTYSDVDPSGASSIAWYAEYLSDPNHNRHLLDRIIKYNEDDCRALKLVRDWLSTPIPE